MRFTSRGLAAIVAALIPIGSLGVIGAGTALAAPGGPAGHPAPGVLGPDDPVREESESHLHRQGQHAPRAPVVTGRHHHPGRPAVCRLPERSRPAGRGQHQRKHRQYGGRVHRRAATWCASGSCTASATASPPTRRPGCHRDHQRGPELQLVHDRAWTSRAHGTGAALHLQPRALPHHGGTDTISIYQGGRSSLSASAPGTIGAAAPERPPSAVYQVFTAQGGTASPP